MDFIRVYVGCLHGYCEKKKRKHQDVLDSLWVVIQNQMKLSYGTSPYSMYGKEKVVYAFRGYLEKGGMILIGIK